MPMPLEHIRVVDMSRLAPGPFCTMVLADLGADVTKVAEPGEAARRGPGATEVNPLDRNKRSIALDLKQDGARDAFYRLADSADVVVEGFRPGVTARLGVDYATLSRRNPRLVYCSISGYGQDGPYRDLPGHDINYISVAGALGIMGRPGYRPTIPHNILADYAGGGLMAATAIMAALLARQTTGRGQYLDMAMTEGTMYVMTNIFNRYFGTGEISRPGQTMLDGALPEYDLYECSDGRYISLGCLEPKFYVNLCQALGREDLGERRQDTKLVRAAFEHTFRQRTRDEWYSLLSTKDICVAKVYSLDEVENDPQVQHRRMVWPAGPNGARQIAPPLRLEGMPEGLRRPPPQPGQHSEEVLKELGYQERDITSLRKAGALG